MPATLKMSLHFFGLVVDEDSLTMRTDRDPSISSTGLFIFSKVYIWEVTCQDGVRDRDEPRGLPKQEGNHYLVENKREGDMRAIGCGGALAEEESKF